MSGLREITDQELTVSVGELISLAPAFVDETWGSLKSVAWTIDAKGKIIKGYNAQSQTQVKVHPFPEEDKTKHRIDFYFTDIGQGLKVQADCVYSKGKKPVKATYTVKRPKVDSFDVRVNSQGAGVWPRLDAPGRKKMSIGLSKGIVFKWEVSADGATNGDLKDLQLMVDERRTKEDSGRTWVSQVRGAAAGDWVLDNSNPYADPAGQPVWQVNSRSGRPAPWPLRGSAQHPGVEDSPSSGLPYGGKLRNPRAKKEILTIVEKSVKDQFRYYLMYKSEKEKSIWIPIAKVEWHWSCTARFSDTKMDWEAVEKAWSASPPVTMNQYIELPVWLRAGGSEKGGNTVWKIG